MTPLENSSLGTVLDTLAEAMFFNRPLPAAEHAAAIRWVVARQGQPGAYAGMFAPTAGDRLGVRLFTGEPVRSRAGIGHVLGEEAVRILAALPERDAATQEALDRAIAGMTGRLQEAETRGQGTAVYCCGTCSTCYWRNLARGIFPKARERLARGLEELKQQRATDGTWHRFPFFATSLTLTELGGERARGELRHAARRWHELLPRLEKGTGPFDLRRAEVGRRVLALV